MLKVFRTLCNAYKVHQNGCPYIMIKRVRLYLVFLSLVLRLASDVVLTASDTLRAFATEVCETPSKPQQWRLSFKGRHLVCNRASFYPHHWYSRYFNAENTL